MSAGTVRAAIAAFMTNPLISGLGGFYQAEPFGAPGSTREPLTGGTPGAGALGFVWISEENEERQTLPVLYGNKSVEYKVTIALLYRYARATNTGSDTFDAWIHPLDDLVDAVKARIRSDPTFGQPSVIFQAGQGPVGSNSVDLKTSWLKPVLVGQQIEAWVAIDLDVIEIITG